MIQQKIMNGRTLMKSHRQERYSSKKPDRVGPIAGAVEMIKLVIPKTAPRFSIGKIEIMVVICSDMITPPAAAWVNRAKRRRGKLVATQPRIVPIIKRPTVLR